VTELQRMYHERRDEGLGHRAALEALAYDTGMDTATISRSLKRAESDRKRANHKPRKEAEA
jgi:hypothetical protein